MSTPDDLVAHCGRWGSVEKLLDALKTCDSEALNAQNSSNGQTPLMIASQNGRADKVWALCSAGAAVDIEDANGRRALHHAVKGKHFECTYALVEGFGASRSGVEFDWERSAVLATGAAVWDMGEQGRTWLRQAMYGGGRERDRRVVPWRKEVHFAVAADDDLAVEMALLIRDAEGLCHAFVWRVAEWLTMTKEEGKRRRRFITHPKSTRQRTEDHDDGSSKQRSSFKVKQRSSGASSNRSNTNQRFGSSSSNGPQHPEGTQVETTELRACFHAGALSRVWEVGRNEREEEEEEEEERVRAQPGEKRSMGLQLVEAAEGGDAKQISQMLEDPQWAKVRMKRHVVKAVVAAASQGHVDCVVTLVDKGKVLDARETVLKTLALELVRSGTLECVRVLAGRHIALFSNASSGDKTTPLVSAIEQGRMDICQLLVNAGVCAGNPWAQGMAMEAAIEAGSVAMLDCLLRAHVIAPSMCHTILCKVIQADNVDMVDLLVASGVDVNGPEDTLDVLLLASASASPEMVQRLLAHGAMVDRISSGFPHTALAAAAANGKTSNVRTLLEAGADIDCPATHSGFTALIAASRSGHEECVRLLLQAGADPNAEGANGVTAFFFADDKQHIGCMEALLKGGFDVESGKQGFTPLMVTLTRDEGSSADTVRLLIEAGANVDAVSAHGATPVWCACDNHQTNALRMLVDAGAKLDVNCPFSNKRAITAAVEKGFLNTVKCMLEVGADVSHVDDAGESALTYAVRSSGELMVNLILRCGQALDYDAGAMIAVEQCKVSVLQMLLEAGADPQHERDGWSLLALAANTVNDTARAAMVKVLLDAGANVHGSQLEEGRRKVPPPVVHAATRGCLHSVQMLLDAGASPHPTGMGSFMCPVSQALETWKGETEEVVLALLRAGATLSGQRLRMGFGELRLVTAALSVSREPIQVLELTGETSEAEFALFVQALVQHPGMLQCLVMNRASLSSSQAIQLAQFAVTLERLHMAKVEKASVSMMDVITETLLRSAWSPKSSLMELDLQAISLRLGSEKVLEELLSSTPTVNLERLRLHPYDTAVTKMTVCEENKRLCHVIVDGFWRHPVLLRNCNVAEEVIAAARLGEVELVRAGIKWGANPNTRAGSVRDSVSVLERAIWSRSARRDEMIQELRWLGADASKVRRTTRPTWSRAVHWMLLETDGLDEELETMFVMNMEEREAMFEAGGMDRYVEEKGWEQWVTLPDEVVERVETWLVRANGAWTGA